MFRFWFIGNTGVVLLLLLLIVNSLGRPQSNFENSTSESGENINRTRPRILTHPPKGDFFGNESPIIFPDHLANRADFSSSCSKNLPYCEEVADYPYDHIRSVVQRNNSLQLLFGTDEAPLEITNRLGDEDEDERLVCRSYRKVIFPQEGETINKRKKFIINQGDDGFVQGIQVELCINPDGKCDIPGTPSIDSGFIMTCKQNYVYRRLLALDKIGGGPVVDSFKMPSACCCTYKRNLDFLSRYGKDFNDEQKRSQRA